MWGSTGQNVSMNLSSTLVKRMHLLGIKDLSKEEINKLLDRADQWAYANAKSIGMPLQNAVICNLFFEASTRTRFSFEVAAKKLGSHVLNFYPNSSSTQKGESLYDTLKTLEAMGTDVAIIRQSDGGILEELAPKVGLSIINAGDGANEHPTQALLDTLTIRQHFGRVDGLKVAIIGDISHSRVANSNMLALDKLGAEVLFSGPEALMPEPSKLSANAKIVSPDEAIAEADVVMMLRIQFERHASPTSEAKIKGHFENYLEKYGLSTQRAKLMKDHAMIMHPAPFNRGVEIDGSLVEGEKSLIYKQVSNGVCVRMAVLERAVS